MVFQRATLPLTALNYTNYRGYWVVSEGTWCWVKLNWAQCDWTFMDTENWFLIKCNATCTAFVLLSDISSFTGFPLVLEFLLSFLKSGKGPWKDITSVKVLNFFCEVLESRRSFSQHDSNKARLQPYCRVLIEKRRFCENDVVDVIQKYTKYIDEVIAERWSRFLCIMSVDRIDTLFSFFSLSTSSQSAFLWLITFCALHIVFLCWFSTLSPSLTPSPFTLGLKRIFSTNSSYLRLPSPGLPPQTITWTVCCEQLAFCFKFFSSVLGSMQ